MKINYFNQEFKLSTNTDFIIITQKVNFAFTKNFNEIRSFSDRVVVLNIEEHFWSNNFFEKLIQHQKIITKINN